MRYCSKCLVLASAGFLWALPAAAEGDGDKGWVRDKKSLSTTDCSKDMPALSRQILCPDKKIPEATGTGTAGVRTPKLKKQR